MKLILALIKRDLTLSLRQGGGVGTALGFFLTVVVLLPIGIGPDQALLARIAPGALWIALLLSVLLSADRIFQQDYEDGSLDIMTMGPVPFEMVALAMVVGSIALSLLAAIGAAVTVGLRRGGLLVSILVLPLYVPVLIFGLSASQPGAAPGLTTASLLILGAIALVSLVVSPLASAAALRSYLK